MKTVHTLDRVTGKIVDWMAIVLLIFIFILGICQVFWRWVLNNPIVWSEEMIRLTYVWICYLGWVIAERADSHIRITSIVSRLPKKAQQQLAAALTDLHYGLLAVGGATAVGRGIFTVTAVNDKPIDENTEAEAFYECILEAIREVTDR